MRSIIDKKKISIAKQKGIIPPHIVEIGMNMIYVEAENLNDVFSKKERSYIAFIEEFDEDKIEMLNLDNIDCVILPTDNEVLRGSFENIPLFKQLKDKPVIANDFFIDEYQIFLSRIYMADGILLRMDIVDDETFRKLFSLSNAIGMLPVVQINNEIDRERLKKFSEISYVMVNNSNIILDNTNIKIMKHITSMNIKKQEEGNIFILKDLSIINNG